jgi:hypothetical protein
MAGYVRNDTLNNIANGNVINAADLDGEFDAIVAAFHASTGHVHDGTAANGAPITKLGPSQEFIGSSSDFSPKTDNTYDLGSATFEFKDAYIDGTAYIDAIDLNGTAITATGTEINYLSGVTSAIQTQFGNKQPLDAELTAIAGLTSAADKVPYFTGSGTAAVADFTSFGRSLVDDANSSAARTTLGLVIGTDVQAYDPQLADVAGLTPTDGNFIVGDGTNFVAESGATARTSLGLGTGNSPEFTAVNIGNATDTTITRSSAGVIAVEGSDVLMASNIGSTVQAYDAQLADVAGLTPTDNGVIIGNGTNFVVESGATLKTSLGLTIGTDVQAYDSNLTSFVNTFTLPTTDGTADQVLKTNGSGILSFVTPSSSTSITISNDTSTTTNLYPTFVTSTSGTASSLNTGNAKLLYKPSTGELQSTAMVSSNGITVNANTIAANYTVDTGFNGLSAGPVTVNSGITVTVASGSVWTVV